VTPRRRTPLRELRRLRADAVAVEHRAQLEETCAPLLGDDAVGWEVGHERGGSAVRELQRRPLVWTWPAAAQELKWLLTDASSRLCSTTLPSAPRSFSTRRDSRARYSDG